VEILEEKIKDFLSIRNSDYVYGYGYDYSYLYLYGSGTGSGEGYGWGSDSGSDSYGSGNNKKIKSINHKKIYIIDEISTIINSIHNNIASGYVVQQDLTLIKCYIVKSNNLFAHGETIKKAIEDLNIKIYRKLNIDEKIEEFKSKFNDTDKYSAEEFYKWHNILTGSCEQGRNTFVKNHNIDLKKDKFTVEEFIEKTKNDYGSDIIIKLK
jgi:hypothetical protein